MFNRRAKAEAPRLEGDVASFGEVVQRLSDDVDRLSLIVADLRSRLDATNQELSADFDRLASSVTDQRSRLDATDQRLEQAVAESRTDHLAIDVAKALELALIDLNMLRRDVDAIRNPDG